MTPERGVLEGVTRRTVLELLEREDLRVARDTVPAAFAEAADEIFITSTAGGVMPVTRINGRVVGDGEPGSLTIKLNEGYWDLHEDPGFTQQVDYEDQVYVE
jgi:branched-chain amino acid aminotransferase